MNVAATDFAEIGGQAGRRHRPRRAQRQEALPDPRRRLPARRGPRQGRRRRQLRHPARRDRGPRRRKRLRQEHARPRRERAERSDRGRRLLRPERCRMRPARRADRATGPRRRRPELAQLERRHRIDLLEGDAQRRFRRNCQMVFQDSFASLNPRQLVIDIVGRPLRVYREASGGGADRAGGVAPRTGGPRPPPPLPLPASVLGRAAAADLDRAGARARSRSHRAGRADLGARRVGAGADPEPALRTPARPGARLPVRHPRPVGRAPHGRPARDDVPGQGGRGREHQRRLRRPAAPLYRAR